jgi:hypothetical protein
MYNRKQVKQTFVAMAIAFLMLAVGTAEATLSTVVGTTITTIQTDALALVDIVWPVVGAITAAFLMFKLFKRSTSKL